LAEEDVFLDTGFKLLLDKLDLLLAFLAGLARALPILQQAVLRGRQDRSHLDQVFDGNLLNVNDKLANQETVSVHRVGQSVVYEWLKAESCASFPLDLSFSGLACQENVLFNQVTRVTHKGYTSREVP
jgi:hypothetical protein